MKSILSGQIIIFMVLVIAFKTSNAQLTPFPGSMTIQGQNFTSGTHKYSYPGTILSPGNANAPVTVTNSAKVTYQSANEIILKNGFHAHSFDIDGQFLGKINSELDMVLITPDPSTSIIDGVVHVPKWEKLEIALKLPTEYQTAINNFFTNYYTNNINPQTDLNPYASDSLEVRIDLIKPDGVTQIVKYAFFMRPGIFASLADNEQPTIDDSSPLSTYPFRFRFAPDEVSNGNPWSFSITISNPQALQGFPVYTYTGFEFICDDPLPDNHGYLHVNTTNNKIFQFDDSTPFFAIGLNIADARHAFNTIGLDWRLFYKLDFDNIINSINSLASVGGNYFRTFLGKSSFNPEFEHLGVYDYYSSTPNTCPDYSGWDSLREGNRQAHAWMLDRLLDKCREVNMYVQLCIDPYPPIIDYQKFIWGDNCYVREYVYPTSTIDANNDGYLDQPYDSKEYFISLQTAFDPYNEGPMYYWKRKYKYILSRWGYSTNIADFETFNEIDQTLGYNNRNLSVIGSEVSKIPLGPNVPNYNSGSICNMNQINYPKDDYLKGVIREWHEEIVPFAKALDGNNHMFSVSYTHVDNDPNYNDLFDNTSFLDINDAHAYAENEDATTTRHNITQTALAKNKPFQFGENSTFAEVDVPATDPPPATTKKIGTSDFYNNYDDSFHREIWSTSMNGSFSTGLSWFWQIIFWWQDGMPYQFTYGYNQPVTVAVNNSPSGSNTYFIGTQSTTLYNSTLYHHFQKLSEFFQGVNLNLSYSPSIYTDESNGIQAIYNIQNTSGSSGYGWLHNYNKYWRTNWVLNSVHNYYTHNEICSPSNSSTYTLSGLMPGETYEISYHATRISGQTIPNDYTGTAVTCGSSGCLSVPVNFTLGCDTTNSDFAFTIICITCSPQRLMGESYTKPKSELSYFFDLSPNPSHESTLLTCKVTDSYICTIYDSRGQKVKKFNFSGNTYDIVNSDVKSGVYYLKIQSPTNISYKKLIIQ